VYVGTSVVTPLLDTPLLAPAGNVIEQRNGINPQTLRIYNTYTDASNYERLSLNWTSPLGGYANISAEGAGTGSSGQRGIVLIPQGLLYLGTNGALQWQLDAGGLKAYNDNAVDIGASGANRPRNLYLAGTSTVGALNTATLAPAGNVIEQRNGTNAQQLRIYNTYTDASNYERVKFLWAGNTFYLQSEVGGTGVPRSIVLDIYNGGTLSLASAATPRWAMQYTGHFYAGADNTYDIGASGANRPRNLFVAGAVATGVKAGAAIDADVNTPTDGMIRLDTTNHRLYVRDGGTWRYAALT
jgi:hypothetical protein